MSGTKPDRNQQIRKLAALGWKFTAIGKRYGISRQRVDQIVQPVKARAREAVTDALASGRLVRGTRCEDCGAEATTEAHHDDYDEPLVVRWLCVSCHKAVHKGQGYRKQTKRRVVVACARCGKERRLRPSAAAVARHCSTACSSAALSESMSLSESELLSDLKRLARVLKRTPTTADINEQGRFSHTTYYRHFGSLTNAVRMVGLTAYGTGGPGHIENRVKESARGAA